MWSKCECEGVCDYTKITNMPKNGGSCFGNYIFHLLNLTTAHRRCRCCCVLSICRCTTRYRKNCFSNHGMFEINQQASKTEWKFRTSWMNHEKKKHSWRTGRRNEKRQTKMNRIRWSAWKCCSSLMSVAPMSMAQPDTLTRRRLRPITIRIYIKYLNLSTASFNEISTCFSLWPFCLVLFFFFLASTESRADSLVIDEHDEICSKQENESGKCERQRNAQQRKNWNENQI